MLYRLILFLILVSTCICYPICDNVWTSNSTMNITNCSYTIDKNQSVILDDLYIFNGCLIVNGTLTINRNMNNFGNIYVYNLLIFNQPNDTISGNMTLTNGTIRTNNHLVMINNAYLNINGFCTISNLTQYDGYLTMNPFSSLDIYNYDHYKSVIVMYSNTSLISATNANIYKTVIAIKYYQRISLDPYQIGKVTTAFIKCSNLTEFSFDGINVAYGYVANIYRCNNSVCLYLRDLYSSPIIVGYSCCDAFQITFIVICSICLVCVISFYVWKICYIKDESNGNINTLDDRI